MTLFLISGPGSFSLSLKGSAVSSAVFWGVCGLVMALGSLSASGQCCVTVLLQGLAWRLAL